MTEVAAGEFVHLGAQLPLDAPGHYDIANLGFIVGSRCVAVIDTGGSMRVGRALRAAIAARTALPICYVINTHVHVDHLLGNAALVGPGTQFVGSAALPAALERSRDFLLRQYAADLDPPARAEELIGPTRTVAGTLELDLGDRRLALRAWPTAHTDCDLTVFDRRTGTLWAGDLLFRDRLPALDGSVPGWLAAIDELSRAPARLTVPGHGPLARDQPAAAAAWRAERAYLAALAADVRSELERGRSMQDAMSEAAAGQRAGWLLWDATHPHNVARVYQQLEWE